MSTLALVLISVAITLVLAYAWFTAQRLKRLHIRTDAALHALQAALDRRAAVVSIAVPETRSAAQAVERISLVPENFAFRAQKERTIAVAIAGLGQDIAPQIVEAEARAQLAYRFYNDAVSDTRALRLRPLVRVLHLGGNAPIPEFFEFSVFGEDIAADDPGL